eukprot:scaffold43787_cov24-Cyclotella_meneghiniana.AAC.1
MQNYEGTGGKLPHYSGSTYGTTLFLRQSLDDRPQGEDVPPTHQPHQVPDALPQRAAAAAVTSDSKSTAAAAAVTSDANRPTDRPTDRSID